jgi:hypothetical protein
MLNLQDIEDCTIPETVQKNTWAKMCEFAEERSLEAFDADIATIEEEFCVKYFSEVEEAKTKSGKWKKSYKNSKGERVYIIPNPWSTSKSIVRGALTLGLEFKGRGQKEVQIAINGAKAVSNQIPFELVEKRLYALLSAFDQNKHNLTDAQIEHIRIHLKVI